MGRLNRFCWWLLAALVVFEIFLGVMHVIVTWKPLGTYLHETEVMFDLDHEGNLSTWFSSAQFLLLGVTLAVIYLLQKQLNPEKPFTWIWLICALGTILLSADEAARIHEWLGTELGWAIDESEPGSLIYHWDRFPSYYWSIIYVPIALPVAIFLGWFYWKELGSLRYLPILGMAIFLVGAVVLDFLEGAYGRSDHDHWRVQFWGFDQVMDTFLIEEMFEMVGVTLILAGCLFHASRLASRWLMSNHYA